MFYEWSSENSLKVESCKYILTLAPVPEPSFLFAKDSGRLFGFIAGGDCSTVEQHEETSSCGKWSLEKAMDGAEEVLTLKREDTSSLWEKKSFCIRITEEALEFWHEFTGKGVLEDVRFFRLCYRKNEFGFGGDFDEVRTSAPNFREQKYFHPCSRVIISNGNDLSLCSGGHALASVPHVMGLHDRRDKGCVSCGVFAEQGNYTWDELFWNPECVMPPTGYAGDQLFGGGFAITYYGKKSVEGSFSTPRLVMTFPEEEEKLLSSALEYAYKRNFLPRPGAHSNTPSWWNTPIYCTWHDQDSLARQDDVDYRNPKTPLMDLCTEKLTNEWIQKLIDHDAKPGIVILDDKWQITKLGADPDPAKWPDMRRWIDECHEKGIRVFLWDLAWHTEDIPADEAITRDGKVLYGDVTNPKYEKRLRAKIRKFFSSEEGGLNADGVKIDGFMALPTGRGLKNHQNIWGLELQRYYLSIVYDEAKKVKKDVCISTYCANPYLDEFTDMVRLADMYTYRLNTEDTMRWRTAIFKDCHPNVLIDTDGQFNYVRDDDYLRMFEIQAELGIPTTYHGEYLRRARFFFNPVYGKMQEKDYECLARVFAEHRKKTVKS